LKVFRKFLETTTTDLTLVLIKIIRKSLLFFLKKTKRLKTSSKLKDLPVYKNKEKTIVAPLYAMLLPIKLSFFETDSPEKTFFISPVYLSFCSFLVFPYLTGWKPAS